MKQTIIHKIRRATEWLYYKSNKSLRYDYWKVLEETQYFSPAQLQTIQQRRLRHLLDYVYNHNQFYRRRFEKAGISPRDIQGPQDLKKLPVLTKKDVRRHADVLLSNHAAANQLLKFKTGGSTGKALEFYISEPCSEIRNAVTRRHDRWTGWEVGESVAAIWGNPEYPRGLKRKLRSIILSPYIYLDTMAVTDTSVLEFTRQWSKAQPTLIFGHAHSIFLLAQYLDRLNIERLRPKGIIASSMMLLPHERNYIEKIFATPVTNRYGCEEVSLIGSECEYHKGMHINIEHLVVENLKDDGSDAKLGELGHIVVTDLMNWTMPFIRYRVEDMGILSNQICSCGRGLPLLDHVAGRVADFLIKEDGTKVAGISLIENTLTRLPGLDQMQIVQHDYLFFKINIVPGSGFNDKSISDLIHYFKSVFGLAAHLDIQIVPKIEPEQSGKYRFSKCNIA